MTLASWGGDPMPDGVLIGSPTESTKFMTRQRAVEVTERARACWQIARAAAGGTIAALAEARAGNAHLVLDFASWHEYVEHVVGDLRELRLSGSDQAVAERIALAQSMRDAGLPYRQIRDRLDVSLGTIRNDIGAPAGNDVVVQLREPAAEPEAIGHLAKTDQVVVLVSRQGDRGLTCLELEHETGWRHGVASGPLSTVARQGRVRATGRFRDGYGVYVVAAGI